MVKRIEREEVLQLMQKESHLVEVLPAKAYKQAHLPKAVNIPLAKLNRQSTGKFERDQPVIVYCYDYQ